MLLMCYSATEFWGIAYLRAISKYVVPTHLIEKVEIGLVLIHERRYEIGAEWVFIRHDIPEGQAFEQPSIVVPITFADLAASSKIIFCLCEIW